MIETFHNYRSLLESFKENDRLAGLLKPGVYQGFNEFTYSGRIFTIKHSSSYRKITQEKTQTSGIGVVMSKQGEIINTDEDLTIEVDLNSGYPTIRIDYLIMEKEYVESEEGSVPIFSIIKGPNTGLEPSIPNPNLQVLIGKFIIQANALSHINTKYVRELAPAPGDLDGKLLRSRTLYNSIDNLDVLTTPGVYGVSAGVKYFNHPGAGIISDNSTCIVFRAGGSDTLLSQLLFIGYQDGVYFRCYNPTDSTFTAWDKFAYASEIEQKANAQQPSWTQPQLNAPFYDYRLHNGSATTSRMLGSYIPAFIKDTIGFVHFRGVIGNSSINNSNPNKIAFTLPPGFRPKRQVLFNHYVSGSPDQGVLTNTPMVMINSQGDVFIERGDHYGSLTFLDGLSFYAEQ